MISPLLFIAALEASFREWKAKLKHEGAALASRLERLTNSRYADDMQFSHELLELKGMMPLLQNDGRNPTRHQQRFR